MATEPIAEKTFHETHKKVHKIHNLSNYRVVTVVKKQAYSWGPILCPKCILYYISIHMTKNI
jgi:hypothetical protein